MFAIDHNPPVYSQTELSLMTVEQLLTAQYQLQLASASLVFAASVYIVVFLTLKWILPKYWYRSRGAE